MATAKISKGTAKGKTWKAEIYKDGEKIKTIQGGQKGTKLGGKRTKAFMARHGNTTAKQYINDLRWKGKAKIGSTIHIPSSKKI
jgi:hypothetical protein